MTSRPLSETGSTTAMHMQVQQGGHSPTLQEQANHLASIPKEVMLISLVSQEQALYNPKHEFYRNTHRKDSKWLEIADTIGWTESQCKSKWKAMRDQYCRELKRSKFNMKAIVKWKYFKELEFLRPFALSRNYRPRSTNKNENLTGSNGKNTCHKLPSIKMEHGHFSASDFAADNVLSAEDKLEPTASGLLTSLSDEQLHSVMQQPNESWNYLTATTTTTTTNVQTLDGNEHSPNVLDNTNLLQHTQQRSDSDDILSVLVESEPTTGVPLQQTQSLSEEDDDPIRAFLNIESFFEKDLINIVQQEDILYNHFHPNYRNAKKKLELWDEIARKLKKPVGRCRLKWKALRDQYIREYKRLKDREYSELLPRWKHYDALTFLQKFIKHKPSDGDAKNVQLNRTELDADIDEEIMDSPPLPSPIEVVHDFEQQTLPTLSGPHTQHELHPTVHDICSSVSAYDDMDIEHYIIGQASNTSAHNDGIGIEAVDDEEDRKSHQHFTEFPPSSTSNMTANNSSNQQDNDTDVKLEVHEFKDIKKQKILIQQGIVSLQSQLQQQQQQSSHQQPQPQPQPQLVLSQQHHQHPLLKLASQIPLHHQQMLTLDVGGETSTAALTTRNKCILQIEHQQQPQQEMLDFSNEMKQQQPQQTLTSGLVNSDSANLTPNNNCGMAILNPSTSLSMEAINIQSLASSSHMSSTTANSTTMHAAPINTIAAPIPIADNQRATDTYADDEVGAFFKAVSMKIRNANMSPVSFTDLQIDILRVINGKLRHN